MRLRLINYLKRHPSILRCFWRILRCFLQAVGAVIPVQPKTMLFSSFGGRKFDDSPKAIWDEVCGRPEFADWKLIWAFVDPDAYLLPQDEKVKMDTPAFFWKLLRSRVWVSNSGMDRGLNLKCKHTLKVETWHGTPLKKICGEEHLNSMVVKKAWGRARLLDEKTLRCAQSGYDHAIFQRLFHAAPDAILRSDLPRNDALTRYTPADVEEFRRRLQIPDGKKAILYTPTYREYLLDDHHENYIAPPMDLAKWQARLGGEYVLLFRAHYAVTAALRLQENGFVRDVSSYPVLNELYAVSDIMISDYSSTFFDYAILDRPMLCFAYDLEEYEEKRGLYLSLADTLPCPVDRNEDAVLQRLQTMAFSEYAEKTRQFHKKFAPCAGQASQLVVDEMQKRLCK